MTFTFTPMLLIIVGACLTFIGLIIFAAVLLGAWIMSKTRIEGQGSPGFFKEPKGEVFTIPDLDEAVFPGIQEPSSKEQHVPTRAKKFLERSGL